MSIFYNPSGSFIKSYEVVEPAPTTLPKVFKKALFEWNDADYMIRLENISVREMNRIMFTFVQFIQRNLTGERSGTLYNIVTYGLGHYRASANFEFPGELSGRLRNSISFANSKQRKILTNESRSRIVRSGRNKTVIPHRSISRRNANKHRVGGNEFIGSAKGGLIQNLTPGYNLNDFVGVPAKQKDVITYAIGTNVPYARDLEFGSPAKGGRPFMRRSFREMGSEIFMGFVRNVRNHKI